MFIIVRESGEYSDHESRTLFACETEVEAEKAVSILNQIDEYNKITSEKYRNDIAEFKKTLNYKPLPQRPHKSTLDPKSLISQKDWENKYLAPFKAFFAEAADFNNQLDSIVDDFKKNYPREIPEEFMQFKQYVVLNEWSPYYSNRSYSVEKIDVISISI